MKTPEFFQTCSTEILLAHRAALLDEAKRVNDILSERQPRSGPTSDGETSTVTVAHRSYTIVTSPSGIRIIYETKLLYAPLRIEVSLTDDADIQALQRVLAKATRPHHYPAWRHLSLR